MSLTQILAACHDADEAAQQDVLEFLRAAAKLREASAQNTGRSTATRASALPRRRLTCEIDMSKLRSLRMDELRALRDVLHTTSDILTAFSCQPRFAGPTDFSHNAAGDLLEDISEWINRYEEAVISVAKAATPKTHQRR